MARRKKLLEQDDVELLDKLIVRFNQLLLWEMSYGVLGVTNTKLAKELEARFKRIREKDGAGLPRTPMNEEYELTGRFFKELNTLLEQFVALEGFGVEYDKRRAKRFAEITLEFEKIARE